MTRAPILLMALAPLLIAAEKPVLVPDISARRVDIRYTFTGAQLLLFGAIVYPGGRPPTKPADIVVVLRGPVQPILLREKQKVGRLIWMNADSSRFRSAPSYYAVASSRPISSLVDERTAAIYEMGLGNLQLSPGGGALPEKERRFEIGLLLVAVIPSDLRSGFGECWIEAYIFRAVSMRRCSYRRRTARAILMQLLRLGAMRWRGSGFERAHREFYFIRLSSAALGR